MVECSAVNRVVTGSNPVLRAMKLKEEMLKFIEERDAFIIKNEFLSQTKEEFLKNKKKVLYEKYYRK